MIRTLTAIAVVAALAAPAQAEIRVGVTMTAFDNPFLTVIREGMQAKAEETGGVEISMEDAELDVGQQLAQVQNFVANELDAIVVNIVDAEAATAITRTATEAGIPLVYVNHPPANLEELPEGVVYVGSDETDAGTLQAEAVCELLGGEGTAVIMVGPLENHAAIVRTQMVKDVFARPECQGIEIVEEQSARWNRVEAQDLMSSWLTAGVQPDAVIANNDEMAIGAIQALKAAGVSMDDVVVAGIDATVDGLAFMEQGDLDVTVFQNAYGQGELAIETAVRMVQGEAVEGPLWIPFEPVTPENMAEY